MGDRRRDIHARAVALQARLERRRQAEVDRGPLAGQQIVVDDLAQQRVAEVVAALGGDSQDEVDHGLAQRLQQLEAVEPGGIHEQLVVEPLADGDHPQHRLHRGREALDPHHQRVAERGRQRSAAVASGRDQLLDEQRMPLRTREHAVHQPGVRRLTEQIGQLLEQLLARQRRQLDPPRADVALELGQHRAQRVPAVQLVGAVGGDDQHPLATQAPAHERHKRSGRPVGPVQILDLQQHRPLLAEPIEQPQKRFEQPRLSGRIIGRRRRGDGLGQPRNQRRELGANRVGKILEHGVAGARERAQRGHQRRVRELALAQPHAVAAERARARSAGARGELGQQPRLANTRVAGDERQPRTTGGCVGERGLELGQLHRASHEDRAGDASGHRPSIARPAGGHAPTHMTNVPLEAFPANRGTLATSRVTTAPRFRANPSSGTLVMRS